MPHLTSEDCRKRAREARGAAEQKHGGRSARIAGHLALAFDALARAKARREGLPPAKH